MRHDPASIAAEPVTRDRGDLGAAVLTRDLAFMFLDYEGWLAKNVPVMEVCHNLVPGPTARQEITLCGPSQQVAAIQ